MDREEIYKGFFDVVKESTEWGIDEESSKYGYYIDGVCSMAQVLLEKLDQKETD